MTRHPPPQEGAVMATMVTQPARSVDPDEEMLRRLRTGDESAFVALVERYQSLMLRVAQTYVRTPSVAEEVVQETWVGVLDGLARFEGRSTLKTWLFRILTNRAKTRGEREARCTPFSYMAGGIEDEDAVEADHFLRPDDRRRPGRWLPAARARPLPGPLVRRAERLGAPSRRAAAGPGDHRVHPRGRRR